MPIPEDPETSSSEDTPMGSMTIDSLDEKPTQLASGARRSFSSDWEEPHPGSRFPVPPRPGNATILGAGIQQQICLEVPTVGMAAKGYRNRRFLRPRIRTSSLKPLKIPATAEEAGVRSVSCCLPQSQAFSTKPIISSETVSTSATIERTLTARTVSTMYGCETEKGVQKLTDDSCESTSSSKHSSTRFSTLTDFSGHLKLPSPAAEDSDASSCMSFEVDNTITPSISPDDDPYGWEAELSKKVAAGRLEFCPNLQYRRAGGAKRSLLQKVLSLGPREFGRSPPIH